VYGLSRYLDIRNRTRSDVCLTYKYRECNSYHKPMQDLRTPIQARINANRHCETVVFDTDESLHNCFVSLRPYLSGLPKEDGNSGVATSKSEHICLCVCPGLLPKPSQQRRYLFESADINAVKREVYDSSHLISLCESSGTFYD
jgi:hypothetical protein